MRLRLEAGPDELRDRGDDLIKALVESLYPVNPELAEKLEKALPHKQEQLKYPVLQELAKKTQEEYERQLNLMNKEIGKVLDRSFKKAFGDLDEEATEGDDEDELEPGDVDPETGELIPEPEEEEEEGEEEEVEKAGPYIGPRGGKWSDPQHKVPWVESGTATKVDVKGLLSGSLGIKRADMPQIRSDLVPDFIQGLMRSGVKVERDHQDVGDLKATQSELNKDKIESMIGNPTVRANLAKPIIVSNDGYVLDGHHRWAAMVSMDPDSEIPTVEVDLPMLDLLAQAKTFKQVEFKTLEKAGPYIGPRGGKWEDVKHTIPWKADRQVSIPGSLVKKVKSPEQVGGEGTAQPRQGPRSDQTEVRAEG
jgi:hypothetical protein